MPIDMAVVDYISTNTSATEKKYPPMKEPWTRVVSYKAYRHIVCFGAINIATNANNISTDGIGVVVFASPFASYDIKGMLGDKSANFRRDLTKKTHSVKVKRML
jgi:hypothetical protein